VKNFIAISLRVIICLLLAGLAYTLATAMMNSLYAYRSPLHDRAPAPGQPLKPANGDPVTRRVVIVLIDALREDTSRNSQAMPFLNSLRQKGASATVHSRPPSYSAPSYSVLLTGAWPDVSDGPAMNQDYAEMPTWTQDNLFSAAHRSGLKTAVSGFNWFERLIPQKDVDASFYTPLEDREADRQVVNAAMPWLQQGDYQLVLIHLDQVDFAGHHEGGPDDPRWLDAAKRADKHLQDIASTLDLSKDTLLVISDHGQIDQGGHGGTEAVVLTEPFVLAGAGVIPGHYADLEQVDVAPTLSVLLGLNVLASSQGHVRSEMLALPPDVVAALPGALQAQQSQLLKAYQSVIGYPVNPKPAGDIVAATQVALEKSRQQRLNTERLPRAILALVLAVLPLVWLVKTRRRELVWLLIAALLYIILYNIRYAVLDGRHYTLSSVISASDIFVYSAVTAAIAMLISWLILSFRLGGFRQPPAQASLLTLDWTLTTIYLLALPVLWSFILNGPLISWTLPDFPSMFLGFVSLVQLMLVAVIGVVLAALAALIARLTTRRLSGSS